MSAFKAFFLGMVEFRQSFTTNCGDFDNQYEKGRELAHKFTFCKYE